MRLNRSDRSVLSDWWFTIDRMLLAAVLLLMFAGVILSLAASPPVAERLGLDAFHFVRRHLMILALSLVLLVAASMLSPRHIRRASLLIYLGGLVLMILTLRFGPEIKGATRWIQFGGFSLQSSEFVKPAFVILSAWLFSEGQKRNDVPVVALAGATYAIFVLLLVLQPDFGQALLVTLVWAGLFFLTGIPMRIVGVLCAAIGVAAFLAYKFVPHVTARVDKFFFSTGGDTFQTDRALQSFERGGWFGQGPGEGTVKDVLPDSHSDFIFAVAAEEYGLVMCMVILALFAFVVMRGLYLALTDPEPGIRFPVTGLMMLFGFQALINMAVNVGMIPAKGMTLPFISYGGSSMLSTGILMGFVIGLTRRRPQTARIHAYRRSVPGRADKHAGKPRDIGEAGA